MLSAGNGNVVLDEYVDEDYEPNEKEVEEYAGWLGMDLQKDRDLFWIAREGLKAPLPKPWRPCQSEDQQIFYFNFDTGESCWDHPCDEHYRSVYQEAKRNRDGGGMSLGRGGSTPNEKKEKKDKKDKKEKKSRPDNGCIKEPASDFDMSMNLPKPGESLFGRKGSNVVFSSKRKSDADTATQSASLGAQNSQAPGWSKKQETESTPKHSTSRASPTPSDFSQERCEAEVEKLKQEHEEFRIKTTKEYEEKRRTLEKELEAELARSLSSRRSELEQQLFKDLDKQCREKVEREVTDEVQRWKLERLEESKKRAEDEIKERTRTFEASLERERKLAAEREVEQKVNSWREDLEKKRHEEIERDVECKLRQTASDLEMRKRNSLERDIDDKLKPWAADFERQAREKMEREVEERMRFAGADMERQRREKLEREVEEKLRPSIGEMEQRHREKLEQEVRERLQPSVQDMEKQQREKLQGDVEARLRPLVAEIEKDVRSRMEKEVEGRLQAEQSLASQTAQREPAAGPGVDTQELDRLQKRVEALVQENEQLQRSVATSTSTREGLEARVRDLELDKTRREAEIESELARLRGEAAEVPALRAKVGESERALAEAARSSQGNASEVERLRATAAEAEELRTKLEAETADLRCKLAAAESAAAARSATPPRPAENPSNEAELHALRAKVADLECAAAESASAQRETAAELERLRLVAAEASDLRARLVAAERTAELAVERAEAAASAAPPRPTEDPAKDTEIAELRRRLAAAEQADARYLAERELIRAECSQLSSDANSLRQRLADADRDAAANITAEKQRLSQSEEAASTAQREAATLRLQLVDLQGEFDRSASELAKSQNLCAEAERLGTQRLSEAEKIRAQRLAEASTAADELKMQLAALEAVQEVARAEHTAQLEEIGRLRSVSHAGADHAVQMEHQQRQQQQLELEFRQVRTQLASEAAESAERARQLQRSVEEATAEASRWRNEGEAAAANGARGASERAEQQREHERLAAEAKQLQARLLREESEHAELRKSASAQGSRFAQEQAECECLRRRVATLQTDAENLQRQLADKGQEAEQLKFELIAKCDSSVAAVSASDIDARDRAVQQLRDDLAAREKAVRQLRDDLTARDRAAQQCQDDLAARNRAVQQLRDDLAARDRSTQQLHDDLVARDRIVAELRGDLATKVEQLRVEASRRQADAGANEVFFEENRALRSGLRERESASEEVLVVRSELEMAQMATKASQTEVACIRAELRAKSDALSSVESRQPDLNGRDVAEEAMRFRVEERLEASARSEIKCMRSELLQQVADVQCVRAELKEQSRSRISAMDEVQTLRMELLERQRNANTEIRMLQSEAMNSEPTLNTSFLGCDPAEVRMLRARLATAEELAASSQTRSAQCDFFRSQLSLTENGARAMQERNVRITADVEAERRLWEEQMRTLRADKLQLERELDEARSRSRTEARRHGELNDSMEEEYRAAKRHLAAQEAEVRELKTMGNADHRREESALAARRRELDEREHALDDKERLMREAERSIYDREMLLREAERIIYDREHVLEVDAERLSHEARMLAERQCLQSSVINEELTCGLLNPNAVPTSARRTRSATRSMCGAGGGLINAGSRSASASASRSAGAAGGRKVLKDPNKVQKPQASAEIAGLIDAEAEGDATALSGAAAAAKSMESRSPQTAAAGEPIDERSRLDDSTEGGPDGILSFVHGLRRRLRSDKATLQADVRKWQRDMEQAEAMGTDRNALADARLTLDVQAQKLNQEVHEAKAMEQFLQSWSSNQTTPRVATSNMAPVSAAPMQCKPRADAWSAAPAWEVGTARTPAHVAYLEGGVAADQSAMYEGNSGLSMTTPRTARSVVYDHECWMRQFRASLEASTIAARRTLGRGGDPKPIGGPERQVAPSYASATAWNGRLAATPRAHCASIAHPGYAAPSCYL